MHLHSGHRPPLRNTATAQRTGARHLEFEEGSTFNSFHIDQAIELFWLGFRRYAKVDGLGAVVVCRARVSLWDFRPSVCFVEVRGLLELPCFVADSTDDEARAVGLGIKLDTYDGEGFRSYASSQ